MVAVGRTDPSVDVYIEKSAKFGRPILRHLRKIVHEACPEVEEQMKWNVPNFLYNGILCSMASFKGYCFFGFWKGPLVVPGIDKNQGAMGQFGRITKISDLPPRTELKRYIRKAMDLNERGVKIVKEKKPMSPTPEAPLGFMKALSRDSRASEAFERFSPSHKREYLEWIIEAKREETRQRRIETAINWISEGKSRNWKYAKK